MIKPIMPKLKPIPAAIIVIPISPRRKPSKRNSPVLSRDKRKIVIAIGNAKRKICSLASMAIACAHGALPAFMIGLTSEP